MEYDEYYATPKEGGRGGGIPRVLVGSAWLWNRKNFLGGLFRKILSYLGKGTHAIGKEVLRAGINIEDIENNTPLKKTMKTRFKESRGNLKRKAEEKINSLMRGSEYKVSAKTPVSVSSRHSYRDEDITAS